MDYFYEIDGPQSYRDVTGRMILCKGGGGGGGGPSSQTVTNTVQLPSYAQPYAEELMKRGADLSHKTYTPYTGQRIAGLSNNQIAGINQTQNQALNGFQGQGDANNLYQSTVRGDFLRPESNPYLQANLQAANDEITRSYNQATAPQTDAAFARSGAFGGSAYNQAVQGNQYNLGKTIANNTSQMLGANYLQERGNQLNAMQLAPQMQNMGYTDAKQLIGAGDIQRSYNQDLLNQQYGDWSAAQNQPYANLDVLQRAISGSVGNASTSMQTAPNPYQASTYANMIGGGLGGAGIAQSLGFSPAIGAGLGAGAGLLF